MIEYKPLTHVQEMALAGLETPGGGNALRVVYTYPQTDAEAAAGAARRLAGRFGDMNMRLHKNGDAVEAYWEAAKEPPVYAAAEGEGWKERYDAPFERVYDAPLYAFYIQQDERNTKVFAKYHCVLTDSTGMAVIGEMMRMEMWNAGEGDIPAVYGGYGGIEAGYLDSQDFEEDRGYWNALYPHVEERPHALPGGDGRCGSRILEFSGELSGEIGRYCAEKDFKATPFRFALAVIGAYMLRRNDADRLPVMTACSCRKDLPDELKYSAGLFANSIALRLEYTDDMEFDTFFRKTTEDMNAGIRHGRYPFDMLEEDILDGGGQPQALRKLAVLSNTAVSAGYKMDIQPCDRLEADIVFRVASSAEKGLQGILIEYRRGAYEMRDVDFICSGIVALARQVLEAPETLVRELPVMGDTERGLLLEEYQGEALDYDVGTTFLDGFVSAAREYPEAAALRDGTEEIGYRVLNTLTDRMGALLEQRCNARGRFCAIMLPRRNSSIVAVLAVLKAGGAYVPIGEDEPPHIVEHILKDSDAAVLITSEEMAERAGGFGGRILFIEDFVHEAVSARMKKPDMPVPDDRAYMMYVQDDSGLPRGACFTHRALRAMIAWKAQKTGIAGQDRTALLNGMDRGLSVLDIFPTLFYGSCLYTIDSNMLLDVEALLGYMKAEGITDASMDADYAAAVIEGYGLPLRRVLLAGELEAGVRSEGTEIYHIYGLEEYAGAVCIHMTGQDDVGKAPFGRPTPGARCYIVDRNMNLLPTGCTGEVCVGGVSLAQGYHNRTDAEAFVENPYGERMHEIFRTGDMGMWNSRGELELTGHIGTTLPDAAEQAPKEAAGEKENDTDGAPQTEMQVAVAGVVADVLGGSAGRDARLDRLGMGPVCAIRTAEQLSRRTGVAVSAREVLEENSIAAVAALMEKLKEQQDAVYERQEYYPLTDCQMAVYGACVEDAAGTAYNRPYFTVLSKAMDIDRLAGAFRQAVEAHPHLKGRIVVHEGEPCQERRDDAPVAVVKKDVTDEEYAAIYRKFVRPFNLFEGPLYRIALYRTETNIHVLADFHNIVFDEYSMDIFMDDVVKAYSGGKPDRERFSAYGWALRQKEQAGGQELARARAYYEKGKEAAGAVGEIPRDGNGGKGRLQLYTEVVRKKNIARFVRTSGVNAESVFLGALCFVANRFARSREMGLSVVVDSRDRDMLKKTTGLLERELPLYIAEKQDRTAADYLAGVQRTLFEASLHKIYTAARAGEEFGFAPQLVYSYGREKEGCRIGGNELCMERLKTERAPCPLHVHVGDEGEYYSVQARYDSALFRPETMRVFAECVANVAAEFSRREEELLAAFSIMTKGQARMVDRFMQEAEESGRHALTEVFEQAVEHAPQKPALTASEGNISYYDLNERANRVANALHDIRVQRGDRIAVGLPRDSRAICAVLGILKAGCAFVMLGDGEPDKRIDAILEDCGARYVVADGKGRYKNNVDINGLLAHHDARNPNVPLAKDHTACLVYTSGSDGKPLGVEHTHGSLLDMVEPIRQNTLVHAAVEQDCRVVSVSGFETPVFVFELFATLSNGLEFVLAGEGERRANHALAEMFAGGEMLCVTSATLEKYMDDTDMKPAVQNCAMLVLGGEMPGQALTGRLRRESGADIFVCYGSAEALVCNVAVVESGRNVGRPQNGVLEQVVDADENALPPSVGGMLWVGGAGLAHGYWNRPELEERVFTRRDGLRWLRTGDIVKWTVDGSLEIAGRDDRRLNLEGRRIEPAEVEAAARRVAGVTGSMAVKRLVRGKGRLGLYYTADRPLHVDEMEGKLADMLPRHMVPAAYLQVDELPADGENGPAMRVMERGDYAAPKTEAEKDFCSIFEEVLGMDIVGLDDSFYDLGGTAAQAARICAEASDRGYGIVCGDILNHQTPRELAVFAARQEQEDAPLDAYDYSAIDGLLAANTVEACESGEKRPLGNVCVAPADTEWGAHLVAALLEQGNGMIYCAADEGGLRAALAGIPRGNADDLFGSRIVMIPQAGLPERLEEVPVQTYIHCGGNENLEEAVGYCARNNVRLVLASSLAVAGMRVDGRPGEEAALDERTLYCGQAFDDRGKGREYFLAERTALAAAVEKGLDVKILRIGNLLPDGGERTQLPEMLDQYHMIGKIPGDMMMDDMCLSPARHSAQAALLLAQAPADCRVFHVYNSHRVYISDLLAVLAERQIEIEPASWEAFSQAYIDAAGNDRVAERLAGFPGYGCVATGKRVGFIRPVNDMTTGILAKLGHRWPMVSQENVEALADAVAGCSET